MKKSIPILFVFLILTTVSCKEKEMPSINIKKEGKIGWDEKEKCSFIYSENNSTIELDGSVKLRGGYSSRYHKHSYAIELDRKYPLGNLPKDDDWILNANYIDKTFMRHKISYDIFREMNEKNVAAQSAYVKVSLNDRPMGLYVLMEEVNASMVGLNKGDTMAMLFKDPPIFRTQKLNYVKDTSNYYNQKYPKIYDINHTQYIEQFIDFLFHSSDSTFVHDVSKWIDIENLIDWHIILLFTSNGDGLMKNFYLYKIDESTPFRIAIWDYDFSYGREGDNERNVMDDVFYSNRAILFERLTTIKNSNYLSALKKRWIELRKMDIISYNNFNKHIVRNDKIIRMELDSNFTIWPVNSKWYYDDNNYDQELEIMREFMDLKIRTIDSYFEGL